MSSDKSSIISVAPGIRLLALKTATLPPATHTNCYLVGDSTKETDFVVIDPGSGDAAELAALYAAVDGLVAEGGRLIAVVLTHHHRDHVDGAAAVRERYAAPVWAHRETAAHLDAIEVARELRDDDAIQLGPDSLRCLHTPGHASGHLCLHHPRTNSLLAGDLVASTGTIIINPPDGHMGQYLASLERMRELGASAILPAHGAPIADPDAVLADYLEHRRAREADVLAALQRICAAGKKSATPMDLVPEVYADIPAHIWPLAARSLLAHLIHLVEQGVAVADGKKFRAPPL
jgi:glyoxylase-like metal-dependent hydrolase (beta-lactamase superfamily II)